MPMIAQAIATALLELAAKALDEAHSLAHGAHRLSTEERAAAADEVLRLLDSAAKLRAIAADLVKAPPA